MRLPACRVVHAHALWLTGIALLLTAGPSQTQIADFQIVWVVIGDVATSAGDQPVQAGRHLFMASDLADLSLKQVRVSRIEVDPTVTALHAGDRLCLSSLKIRATAPDGSLVKRAPLSVSVRQDHRDSLQLERTRRDICMQPDAAGEYPVRFTSLLPAADGSTRGAQIFVRVTGRDTPAPAQP
ncbi:MAG TPA: hypothetical protein PKE27_21585 [Povalibacter sp.]|uniref:hypothetical protein n=1 Tax=Povalibacter sp. TaxID=1962978 RepID=UPI002BB08231|nr:hypothetical protein [Povalibacter sp.]HMN47185.1 hypothetical protein [Povalibacter sp.]